MPVVKLHSRYSEEKIDELLHHYSDLYDFLHDHTHKWETLCNDFSRHVFFYPYHLCVTMKNLCSRILSCFNTITNSELLSEKIKVYGRQILEIQQNEYTHLGVIATSILQNGGFTLENLIRLYERYEAQFYSETSRNISFPFLEIASCTGIDDLDDFLEIFRIESFFVPEIFDNGHDFLRHDEWREDVTLMDGEYYPDDADLQADYEVARIMDPELRLWRESIMNRWECGLVEESIRYVQFCDSISSVEYEQCRERRSSIGTDSITSSNDSDSLESVFDNRFIPMEQGEFEEFEDYIQFNNIRGLADFVAEEFSTPLHIDIPDDDFPGNYDNDNGSNSDAQVDNIPDNQDDN